MQAGKLRQQLQVMAKNITGVSDRGQPTLGAPSLIATIFAQVEPLSGRKLELARQLVATATHEVTIRYLAGLTVENWFLFGTRQLNIGNVQNIQGERNLTQKCLCIEQVSGAV